MSIRGRRVYLIYDNELDSLSDIESVSAACWSTIIFCLSVICGSLWDIGFSPEGEALFGWGWILFWLFVAGGVTAFLVGLRRRRASIIQKIKDESGDSTRG